MKGWEEELLKMAKNWPEWAKVDQEDDLKDMHRYIYTSTSKTSSTYNIPKPKECNPGDVISAYEQKWIVISKGDGWIEKNWKVINTPQGVSPLKIYSSEIEEIYG